MPVSGSQSTLRFWRMAYLAYGQARHGLRIWSRDRRRRLVGQREVPVRHPKIAEASDEHIVGRFMPQRRIPHCHVCRQQRCDRYKQFWWHRARWPCTPLVTHIHSGVGSRVQHEVSYGAIAIPYPAYRGCLRGVKCCGVQTAPAFCSLAKISKSCSAGTSTEILMSCL